MRKILNICIIIFSLISSITLLVIPISEKNTDNNKTTTPISIENEVLNFDEEGEEIEISNIASTNDGYYYDKLTTDIKQILK